MKRLYTQAIRIQFVDDLLPAPIGRLDSGHGLKDTAIHNDSV
jgi:hypothetical protein